MSTSSPLLITIACLLLVARAHAQTAPACREPSERPIELGAERCGRPPQVRVSAGLATVLLFDTPVARVDVSEPALLHRVAVHGDVLTLVPKEPTHEEASATLTVYFANGAAPTQAVLQLTVETPARAERQVEVLRRARTVASFKEELERTQRENQRLRQENEHLRAAQSRPGGLVGVWLSGEMGASGVLPREFQDVREHPRNGLGLRRGMTFRAQSLMVVATLMNPPDALAPWHAVGAALVGPGGAEVKVLRLWQSESIDPGTSKSVLVETDPLDGPPRGPYTLTLWAEGGKRAVILSNIEFP